MRLLSAIIAVICCTATILSAQDEPQVIHLWPNGAPGFEDRKDEPEQAQDWWVKNVHNPSVTVFLPPKEKANGTAVVIFPGGGHRTLVFNSEGRDAAVFLNSLGITAFALKYRLAREENSPYSLDVHPQQDAYRAIRLVRHRAKEWGIDPGKVGVMGFSAGGEVAAFVAYGSGAGDPSAKDPIDRESGKPDFQILVYPGPLGVPDSIQADAPPAFMVAAIDDACCSGPVISLLNKYHAAQVPAEVHIYGKGGHAFNMGYRSSLLTLRNWPQRLTEWLFDNGGLMAGEP